MTFQDPPRLRTQRDLPRELAAALQFSEQGDLLPESEELRDLERRVLAAAVGVAAVAAAASGGHGGKLAVMAKLLTIKLGVWVLPALTGAGLGVCALGASHLLQTATSHESARSSSATVDGPRVSSSPRFEPNGSSVEPFAPSGVAAAAPAPRVPAPSASASIPASVAHDRAGVQGAPVLPAPSLDIAQGGQEAPGPTDLAELREVDLIERAHRAMANNSVLARACLKEHERRFPDGTFAQEREAIAIEVLVRQGDVAGARARAIRFFARFPGSTYAEHIESMVRTNAIHRD